MNQPLVSIIIPLYNRINLVQETIASVQAQTYPNWEAIVVDDGSTDGSFELVKDITKKDNKIRLIQRKQPPKGAPTCRNIGADEAQGEFIIFLDSDDLLAPFCLEHRIIAFQQYPDYDFLVFPMLLFKNAPGDMRLLWNIDTDENDLSRFLRWDPVWQTTCPIYKKISFMQSGRFDEGLFFWQDYELHIRLLYSCLKYKKLLGVKPDCYYRKHDNETLSQAPSIAPDRLILMEKTFQNFYRELSKRNLLNTTYARCISAVIFWFSLRWIMQFKYFSKAMSSWQFCYENKLIGQKIYRIGAICLWIKHIQTINTFLHIFLKPMYKVFILLLPKIYRNNQVTAHTVYYNP